MRDPDMPQPAGWVSARVPVSGREQELTRTITGNWLLTTWSAGGAKERHVFVADEAARAWLTDTGQTEAVRQLFDD